ncbi:MAG TPA: phage holin family protein [Woeseiaceae bacterium]|nr:phage holin family protein [Woeseiaceae bacterium]
MTIAHNYQRTVPEIVSDVLSQVTRLFRKEMQLARTEVTEKVGRAVSGIVMLLIGAVLLIPALVILLMAGVAALVETGMEAHWASLIVGGATLLIGAILALVGMSRLKAENLAPTRTIEQLQRDAAVAREQVNHA